MPVRIKNELAVGIIFLLAMVILGYYTVIMVDKFIDYRGKYKISVYFDNVEGLEKGNLVKVNGVVSGNVEEVKLIGHRVYVILNMHNEFTLYENYVIKIKSEIALGEPHVSIYPGRPVDKDGNKYATLPAKEDLVGKLDDPFASLSELVAENRENINQTIRNLREITSKINKGEGTIGKLVNRDDVHKQADKLVEELRDTIEDVREQAPITSFLRSALTIF